MMLMRWLRRPYFGEYRLRRVLGRFRHVAAFSATYMLVAADYDKMRWPPPHPAISRAACQGVFIADISLLLP